MGVELPFGKYSPDWTKVSPEIKKAIKTEEKKYRDSCVVREVPPKHKYALVKGTNRKETRELRKRFLELYKTYPYPKERGK